jgi:beta-galactosidase
MLQHSESASAFSSRGVFIFPVLEQGDSAPVNDSSGGNSTIFQVSAYELYSADFGSSADKAFRSLDMNPNVAGEFVWTGWDYLGEPTPYNVRSSYSGMIDLAGFPKERFYIYQSRWRPDLPMAHILPHWNWPDRVGKATPVHVFSSGDEAELFVNGKSQGRQKKEDLTYRFRWNNVIYQPGEVRVVAYKNGREWATDVVQTTGEPAALRLHADRSVISADGVDLSFITVEVVDRKGNVVPQATSSIQFSVSGAGQLVATDNGDASDYTSFPSAERQAFSGRALAIVKGGQGKKGQMVVKATAKGLKSDAIVVGTQ